MSKKDEVRRKYNIPDTEMLQFSGVFRNMYVADLAQFSNLDPSLNEQLAADWETANVNAELAAKDLEVQDELAVYTQNVQDKLEECRKHYQRIKYFVSSAWPNDGTMERVFNFDGYDKARKSETEMVSFLVTVHKMAVKYADKLIAANCTQEDIDKIETLANDLREADREQEVQKKSRLVFTQERINTLNAAWEFVQKINRASKVVFSDDAAKLKQYLLPGEPGTAEEETPAETGE